MEQARTQHESSVIDNDLAGLFILKEQHEINSVRRKTSVGIESQRFAKYR